MNIQPQGESMRDDEKTDFHERLVALETKLDGGPGLAPICKMHQAAVDEIRNMLKEMKNEVGSLNSKFVYATGALAGIMLVAPWIRELMAHAVKKL